MVMLALLHLNGSEETSRVGNVKLNGAVLGLCFSILVILAFSPYSKEQLVKFCLLLMDVYILVAVLKVNEMESATKVFYWASMVVVAGTFVMYLVSPVFLFEHRRCVSGAVLLSCLFSAYRTITTPQLLCSFWFA